MRQRAVHEVTKVLLLGMGCLIFVMFSSSVLRADQESGTVSIVIRDSAYEFRGGALRPNEPAAIILRNEDKIQHGFTSELFETFDVRIEGHGAITYGRGIRGVYIKPGETIRILFTPVHPGQISFRCDLHPKMRGELLIISIGAV